MDPQDTLTQIGAIAGIAAAVWLIIRDVVPLAFRLIGPTREWARRTQRSRQAARDKRAKELSKSKEELRIMDFRAEYRRVIMRLREMELDDKSYHTTEWKRQIRACLHHCVS